MFKSNFVEIIKKKEENFFCILKFNYMDKDVNMLEANIKIDIRD